METYFFDSNGDSIAAHCVQLEKPWTGSVKLIKMVSRAIAECLADIPLTDWPRIPLLLCLAEPERPGRLDGIEDMLFAGIADEMKLAFDKQSVVLTHGRAGAGAALLRARRILAETHAPYVLIAATDSYLLGSTLKAYEDASRLLTPTNSNGFIPGEGAGALLVGRVSSGWQCVCTGLGFAIEPATIDGNEPLRGDGLTQAIHAALGEAGCAMHDLDFRITDVSGEQYYFKEAALAMSRTLRKRKKQFDIWQPSECIGEIGAVSGLALIVVADAAFRKGYASGPNLVCHTSTDAGQRTAAIFQFRDY